MTTSTVNVSADDLTLAVAWLLKAAGMLQEAALTVARAVVGANMRGVDSHGVGLVPRYTRGLMCGALNPRPALAWELDTGALALLDADNGPGHLAAATAMKVAVDKARTHGIGCVLVRNSNHFGMASFYTMTAASQGCLGMATTNGPPVMAAYGGASPVMCNNPISIAVPGVDRPVVLDMALSTVARGRIRDAELKGQEIPLGWARDASGAPTTDPSAALQGSLEWIGGYKGFGLAVMMEILAGVLSGARFGSDVSAGTIKADTFSPAVSLRHGHAFFAIATDRFMPAVELQHRVEILRAMIQEGEGSEVILPGDREAAIERERHRDGIPLLTRLRTELVRVADEATKHVPRTLEPRPSLLLG